MNGLRSFFTLTTVSGIIIAMTGLPSSVFAQTTTSSNPNASVAAVVQSYFANNPVMVAIAKCESGPRQFAANGTPLYAGTDNAMVGVFQIDSQIHTAPALALGFDITTLAGNLAYANYLYGQDGTEPWISSFSCWGSSATPTTSNSAPATTQEQTSATTGTPTLTENLSLGAIDPQVIILQQLLNQAGFTLATSGPGSPGNETDKFGALTYAALKAFQCAKGIACSGDEATTGYGLLNAATRTTLLAATATTTPVAITTNTPTETTVASTTITTSTDTTSSEPVAVIITSSTPTSTIIATSTADDMAEISELESRIASLVAIVNQLEAEIASRT